MQYEKIAYTEKIKNVPTAQKKKTIKRKFLTRRRRRHTHTARKAHAAVWTPKQRRRRRLVRKHTKIKSTLTLTIYLNDDEKKP